MESYLPLKRLQKPAPTQPPTLSIEYQGKIKKGGFLLGTASPVHSEFLLGQEDKSYFIVLAASPIAEAPLSRIHPDNILLELGKDCCKYKHMIESICCLIFSIALFIKVEINALV